MNSPLPMRRPAGRIDAIQNHAASATSIIGGIASGLAAMTLGMIVFAWQFSFDEFLHLHYLWLTSIGRIPHVDFWCHYPALGYVVMRPFFGLLPESIYADIALRFFDVALFAAIAVVLAFHARRLRVHWVWGVLPLLLMLSFHIAPWIVEFRTDACAALPAVLALTLLFREPRPGYAALAAGLSVLSVLIMPKYLYPLAFANCAYAVVAFLRSGSRRSILLAMSGGALSVAVFAQLLLLSSKVWLWDDLYWSPILMHNYHVHCAQTDGSLQGFTGILSAYFSANWWVVVLAAAGIAGLAVAEARRRGAALWVGVAVLVGVAVSWFIGAWPFIQYLIPGLFCLALFMPYIPKLLGKPAITTAAGLLLACLALGMTGDAIRQVAPQLSSSTLMGNFSVWEALLKAIPRSEKVVGFYGTHPCFREDQTFVTWNERWGNPPGFTPILPKNSHAAACFEPSYLAQSLEQSPPAAIGFSAGNYPPGWNEVLQEFLGRHGDSYVKFQVLGQDDYLRKDLLPRGQAQSSSW